MAETNEKDVSKKSGPEESALKEHDGGSDKAKAGEKTESGKDQLKDAGGSPAAKLLDSISREDQQACNKKSWQLSDDSGTAAKMLAKLRLDLIGASDVKTSVSPDGRVETIATPDKTVIKTPSDTIIQSPVDADGKHITTVIAKDGRTLSQDRQGIRTATNKDSDLTLKEDPNTHKVELFDRFGKEIAELDRKGDATRYFHNAIAQVVQPPQTLDDAYKAFLKEHPEKLRDQPLVLVDGKGETLIVRPDFSTIAAHRDGHADAVLKQFAHDGKPDDFQVSVTAGPDGKQHLTIGRKGGEQHELDSEAARKLMAHEHSRLRLDESGNLMVNDDSSGDPQRGHWRRFLDEQHRLEAFPGGHLDVRTGQVVIDDDKTHAVYAPDKDTGVMKMTETNRHPDGSLDANPARVWTMDHGKVITQGVDPITGQVKANDLVTYDSKTNTVNAWNIEMTRDNATLINPDGSRTSIDQKGDVHATDEHGNHIVDTQGDRVSYDGGQTYANERGEASEKSRRAADDEAKAAAEKAALAAQAIDAHLSADMTVAELSALGGLLDAAIARCAALQLPIPAMVTSAQSELPALIARAQAKDEASKRGIDVRK